MSLDLFDDVIGHRSVIELLRSELRRPAQAYLFVGPASTGKATVARRLAASIVTDDPAGRRRALNGSHPDLVLIEPEGRTSITVDQTRQVVAHASLYPLEGIRRVFLVEEAAAMNDEAANSLLKTLEEPTRSTAFVLVAESETDLPATVGSRSRTIVLGRVADEDIIAALEERGVERAAAASAAGIAAGRPGLAVALATDPATAAFRRCWLDIPRRLSEHPGDAFLTADRIERATEPLLAAVKARQRAELAAGGSEGRAVASLKDRHDRQLKRASTAIYQSGLEILAGFYRDTAAAQFGAVVRNSDISAADLTQVLPAAAVAAASRVLETADALRQHQRPRLALAALLSELGAIA